MPVVSTLPPALLRTGASGARRMLCMAGFLLAAGWAATQEAPVPEPLVGDAFVVEEAIVPPSEEGDPAVEETAPVRDEAAAAYMMKCMGCHTIGGGAITGPDLKTAATYPRQTVWDGIKRMEKMVGPLGDDEIDLLTDLLLSPAAGERVEAHREQARMREAATMEPPSVERGRALYFGRATLTNGGLSCAACHQAGGRGGNLASSLEDAYTRLGEASLLATTETPGFPVMRAIYEAHPVTRQEALHVVAFLEHVANDPAAPLEFPLHLAGLVGAVGLIVVMGKATTKRAAGTRARMVAETNRRSNRGVRREKEAS